MATQVHDIGRLVHSYDSAMTFLDGRLSKKLAHNTYVVKRDLGCEVTYHGHVIAMFYAHGEYMAAWNCGLATPTTKTRINELIPNRYSVYQKNFRWFVWDRLIGQDWPWEDGDVFWF